MSEASTTQQKDSTRREEPCDCHVLEGAIVYCPLHAAALVLLEALEDLLGFVNTQGMTGSRTEATLKAESQARAAIAEARPIEDKPDTRPDPADFTPVEDTLEAQRWVSR